MSIWRKTKYDFQENAGYSRQVYDVIAYVNNNFERNYKSFMCRVIFDLSRPLSYLLFFFMWHCYISLCRWFDYWFTNFNYLTRNLPIYNPLSLQEIILNILSSFRSSTLFWRIHSIRNLYAFIRETLFV